MTDTDMDLVTMIRDSAGAVAPRDGDYSRIRKLRFTAPGFDRDVYREMANLGWIGLRLPEDKGGVGLGLSESVALYEELGRGLVPEPLIAATLAASLLAATDEAELFASLLAGETLVATAWAAANDAIDVAEDPAAPRRAVVAADAAEWLLVPTGEALRLVPAGEAEIAPVELQDGGRMFVVTVPAGAGRVIGNGVDAALNLAIDEAALGTAAYLLGVAEAAFAMTLDYLKQRKQFGQALAAFQALQHRAADILIQLALTRASIVGAAADIDGGVSPRQRAIVVSRAKARAADTAMLVGREAIQLHGAIGYTDEYDVGLFTRKAMAVANLYGSAIAHRRRYAALAEDLAA